MSCTSDIELYFVHALTMIMDALPASLLRAVLTVHLLIVGLAQRNLRLYFLIQNDPESSPTPPYIQWLFSQASGSFQ